MKAWGLLIAIAIMGGDRASAVSGDQNWDSRFGLAPGFNGPVRAFAVLGTDLFVAGEFTQIGDQEISHIARWDGTHWHSLGTGMAGPFAAVLCLATDGTNLYAGGQFTLAGGIAATNLARWDGHVWSTLGSQFHQWDWVGALAATNSKLYVGGRFDSAGGITATNIAAWDGVQWSALGTGLQDLPFGYGGFSGGHVGALLYDGTNLYAGGTFKRSGDLAATNIARWDGSQWHSLGEVVSEDYFDYVGALALTGGRLLVGGRFVQAGGVATTNLAWWDGTAWSAFPTDTVLSPTGFLPDGPDVIVFGEFPDVGGTRSSAIASFDGGNWSGYGAGIIGQVAAAVRFGTNLYVGGEFQLAGGKSAGFLARWDGQMWQSLFPGTTGALFGWPMAMTVNSNGVFVAGNLVSAGETPAKYIAHFDGNEWTSMDNGLLPDRTHLLASVGTNLYVVEQNPYVIPSPTPLMRWNGTAWSAVTSDLTNAHGFNWTQVTRLAAGNTNLFVAGYFTGAGSVTATNLARWDGSQWHSMNYQPLLPDNRYGTTAMTARGETLFIAENYLVPPLPPLPPLGTNPSAPSNAIRYWNGTNWFDIGASVKFSGDNDAVAQIVCLGSNLFVGGHFVATNPVPATNLLRWDGSAWHAVDFPFGTNSWIASLAASGTNLYVRGRLWDARNSSLMAIAKFDGSKWSGLGNGIHSAENAASPLSRYGTASDIVAVGREVYLGGGFTTAGCKSSYRFALWHEFPTVTLSSRGWLSNGNFNLRIVGASGQTVQIQASSNLLDWSDLGVQTPALDDFEIEDSTSCTNATRFYRALLVP